MVHEGKTRHHYGVIQPPALPGPDEIAPKDLLFVVDNSGSMSGKPIEACKELVRRALAGKPEPGRVRIVFFLTDGYIGNEHEILRAVQEENEAGARLFSLGVGSSVNRYLLASMARLGRGTVEVMRYDEDPSPFVSAFYRRVRNPVLTDVSVDWGGLGELDVEIPTTVCSSCGPR